MEGGSLFMRGDENKNISVKMSENSRNNICYILSEKVMGFAKGRYLGRL